MRCGSSGSQQKDGSGHGGEGGLLLAESSARWGGGTPTRHSKRQGKGMSWVPIPTTHGGLEWFLWVAGMGPREVRFSWGLEHLVGAQKITHRGQPRPRWVGGRNGHLGCAFSLTFWAHCGCPKVPPVGANQVPCGWRECAPRGAFPLTFWAPCGHPFSSPVGADQGPPQVVVMGAQRAPFPWRFGRLMGVPPPPCIALHLPCHVRCRPLI